MSLSIFTEEEKSMLNELVLQIQQSHSSIEFAYLQERMQEIIYAARRRKNIDASRLLMYQESHQKLILINQIMNMTNKQVSKVFNLIDQVYEIEEVEPDEEEKAILEEYDKNYASMEFIPLEDVVDELFGNDDEEEPIDSEEHRPLKYYLTEDELKQITDLKIEILTAESKEEIRLIREEVNLLLQVAESRRAKENYGE